MPESLLTGNDGADSIQGGAADDLIYGYDPSGPQGNVDSISGIRVATGLDQPLFTASPPGDLNRLFVVEKTGAIRVLDLASGQVGAEPFLDLSGQISIEGERGLLGFAFHPDFAQNGYFYVNLIRLDGSAEIRRYQVSAADPDRADASSGETVVVIEQSSPYTFYSHKAGWLGFGPDGYLYSAIGDGGSGSDPHNSAQNLDSLLGKMLRLDVDADAFPADPTRNYSVPADNPFTGIAGADELWALGLRNPWRASFDRALGELFIGDVGEVDWEEVNIGQAGANYGWRIYEGLEEYLPAEPSGGTLTAPVHVYEHFEREMRSITGGYVYRGPAEGLHGDYFFADFMTGQVYSLDFDGSSWVATERTGQIALDAGSIDNPVSFGEDGAGSLYVVDFDGDIFRLMPDVSSADRADLLRGLGGDDMLFGGSGDDTLQGGDGDDELQGGRGANHLVGGNGADRLIGLDSRDRLDGGEGPDVMAGGGGADVYVVDDAGDVVFESTGQGMDTVRSSVTERLAPNVERLALTGSDNLTGIGNALDNILVGNRGANLLKGLAGDDTLVWSASDRYNGGAGSDTLRVSGDGITIDLRAVENTRILNVEVIDLSRGGDNTLKLKLRDLLDLSSTTDTLRVDGDAGDTVRRAGDWVQGADVTIGANNYFSYTRGAGTLLVDTDISVI
jgi:glucose/arabinose dehydrogenase